MADIMSYFFPQTNGLTQRIEASQSAKQNSAQNPAMENQQFSAEFFALLQGEISALTSTGQGKVTSSDIKNMSDEQIEVLGEFLGNVEIGENGKMIYSSPDAGSFRAPLDTLPVSLARSLETANTNAETVKMMQKSIEAQGIDISPDASVREEDDPMVLEVLERIRTSVLNSGSNEAGQGKQTAFEKLGGLIEQFLGGLPKESRATQSARVAMNADAMAIAVDSNGNPDKLSPLQAQGNAEARAELIATGLSPDKITQLLEKMAAMTGAENKGGKDTKLKSEAQAAEASAELESDVTFTLVTPTQTTPAAEEQNVIFLPRGIVVSENSSSRENRNAKATDLDAKIGNGQPENSKAGENVARALNKALESLITQGSMTGLYGEGGEQTTGNKAKSTGEASFERIFTMFEQAKTDSYSSATNKIQDGADKSTTLAAGQLPTHAEAKAAAKLSAGLSTIQANFETGLQTMSSSNVWNTVYPEGMDWSTAPGIQGSTPNNSVQLATMTSLVSQNNAATAAHPSTQMVAATISKAGQSDNKMLTLRLDPPDLGRVQVKMELTEDNVVKAIISSEKPQTHMMLQRDAHVLERALQEAGIDTAGGSLEFELSEDGSLFGDNDGRGGDNDSGGGNSATGEDNSDDGTLIESTMTWQVDPETGYMHYNLVV